MKIEVDHEDIAKHCAVNFIALCERLNIKVGKHQIKFVKEQNQRVLVDMLKTSANKYDEIMKDYKEVDNGIF